MDFAALVTKVTATGIVLNSSRAEDAPRLWRWIKGETIAGLAKPAEGGCLERRWVRGKDLSGRGLHDNTKPANTSYTCKPLQVEYIKETALNALLLQEAWAKIREGVYKFI